MGKAIGGYVRRCERKPASRTEPLRPWARPFPYPEPPTFQCMPILTFVPFDVEEPVDNPGMTEIRFPHGTQTF